MKFGMYFVESYQSKRKNDDTKKSGSLFLSVTIDGMMKRCDILKVSVGRVVVVTLFILVHSRTCSSINLSCCHRISYLTASVLGTDAVADSPLEVGLRVGLDKGVNWADVSLSVATTAAAVTSGSSSNVLVITTDAQMLGL